jgi:hypothetical protein
MLVIQNRYKPNQTKTNQTNPNQTPLPLLGGGNLATECCVQHVSNPKPIQTKPNLTKPNQTWEWASRRRVPHVSNQKPFQTKQYQTKPNPPYLGVGVSPQSAAYSVLEMDWRSSLSSSRPPPSPSSSDLKM